MSDTATQPEPPVPAATTAATTATPVGAGAAAAAPPQKRRRFPWWIVFLVLLVLGPVAMCAPVILAGRAPALTRDTILELDLEAPLLEDSASDFFRKQPSVREVVFGLENAAKDDNVKALFVRVGATPLGLGITQELRDAIVAFKKSGKPEVGFSETLGEMAPGTGGYYLASVLDEIWLQPLGAVAVSGLFAEGAFAKDGLAKLGVEPRVAARKEYKNAPNTFTENGFTEPHKEATLALLDSAMEQVCTGVAAARPKLGDATAVRTLLLQGPYDDVEALKLGLVDAVGYRDEALLALKKRASIDETKGKLLYLHRYLERAGAQFGPGPTIAVVTAAGQIMRGSSQVDPLSGSRTLGSDTVAGALREAIRDDDVKAILLRIDSPGGSVVASETIWHEVERAKKEGKPVIASMGNVAGSGGYFIAMGADAIVAQPGTITGSIGVYAGKPVTEKMWQQLGINFEVLPVAGGDASFFSTDVDYSPAARAKLEGYVDRIYSEFVRKVAAGRKRSFDEMEPHARGRIWTGQDARERALVDELGGFPVALALLRQKLGLAPDAPLHLKPFPQEKSPLLQLLSSLRGQDGDSSDETAQTRTRPSIRGAAVAAEQAARGSLHDAMWLMTPAVVEIR